MIGGLGGRPAYLKARAAAVSTSEATVFTAPGFSIVYSILVANKTAWATTVTVKWRDTSATTDYHIAYQTPIQGNGTYPFELGEHGIPLEEGDLIKVTAGDTNALDVTVVAFETTGRSG